MFGQWTLVAFQIEFAKLADEMLKIEVERKHDQALPVPVPVPEHELALRSNLAVPS